jgi:hypothetical protein
MRSPGRLRLTALALLALAGCGRWPDRPPVTAETQAVAHVAGFGDIRLWADASAADWAAWRARWMADRTAAGLAAGPQVLAISSGSDKGAFSAGYLAGWTAAGTRPRFDLVTGVSTGALEAPFAFLGPDYDGELRSLYTGIAAHNIYRARALSGLLGGPAFADTKPLQGMIAQHISDALIDRIAAEHRRGRRLLVMTTNLDAARGVVWDMGAIAASASPEHYKLFRQVILASAAIPGVFPPVLIDVAAGERRFSELHVDGGTISSLFVLPPAVLWGDASTAIDRQGSAITLLYNGKLSLEYQVVKPRAFTIMGRSLSTVISAADQQNVSAYRRFASDHRIPFSFVAIGPDFTQESRKMFDPAYMGALYEYGRRAGGTAR